MPVQSIQAGSISTQCIGAGNQVGGSSSEEEEKREESSSEEKENQKEDSAQDTTSEEIPRLKVIFHEYEKSDTEIYLKAGTNINIEINKEEFNLKHVRVKFQSIHYDNGEEKNISSSIHREKEIIRDISQEIFKDASWQETANKHILSFSFKEEGHYRLSISTKEEGEIYRSPLITIDETAPVVEVFSCNQNPLFQKAGYDYYDTFPSYELIIAEENFDEKTFHLDSNNQNLQISSWTSYYENGIRKNRMTFTVKEDGRYDISWEAKDGSGLHKVNGECHFIIDHSQAKISISNESAKDLCFYDYKEISIFAKKSIPFCLWAEDRESGVESIIYSYWNKEGKIEENTLKNDEFSEVFSKNVSLDMEDFQGWISMRAINGRGLESEGMNSQTFLWESKDTHDKISSIHMSMPEAIYTDEESKIKYYREKPEIFMEGSDKFSGIQRSYMKASFEDNHDKEEKKYSDKKDITYDYKQKCHFSLPHMNTSNAKKAIKVAVGFVDNAGHSRKHEYDYGIVVDNKEPEVSLSYDLNQDNPYYNETRTATISVEDYNLNTESVHWKIQGPKDGYKIGKWHKDGKDYSCHVTFSGEGEYQLGFSIRDFAGNQVSFQEKESFFIDKATPDIQLWMDEEDLSHEKFYKKAKMIYVLVKDEHVKMEDIHLYSGKRRFPLKNGNIGREISGKFVENMRQNGWKIYGLNLNKDGLYQLQVSCVDQAGNPSVKVKKDPFIIDQKLPEISFEHLRERITYTDQINAKIMLDDNYLDQKECKVEVYRQDGKKAGFLDERIICTNGKGSSSFQLDDFPKKQQYDNHYLLKVTAKDLAGNEKISEIPFSVNRFGVRYDIEDQSKKYLKHYYHKEEQDITVKAYSLNPLMTDVIVTMGDGKIILLDEDSYEMESHRIKEKDEEGLELQGRFPSHITDWYETSYRLPKELFLEEGNYDITLRSREECLGEDHWFVKESENMMWTEPIQFAIDKTLPTVELGGLDKSVYTSNRHQYTITAMDNYQLKRVRIHVRKDGLDETKDYKEGDFDELHRITAELSSSAKPQIISYEAWDEAGNQVSSLHSSLEKTVLVTQEPMIREIKKRSYGILIGMLLASSALLFLTRHRFFAILKNSEKNKTNRI